MARKRGRAPEEFSLSFLDVICCGFGAVILLLMITKTVEPQIIEAAAVNLEGKLAKLQEELFEVRGETRVLNRDLNAKREQLSEHEENVAVLTGELSSLKSRHDNILSRSQNNEAELGDLALAQQRLTEEMQRLLRDQQLTMNNHIAGIPADSEYIIFVIDTSGSMVDVREKMTEVMGQFLDSYPTVKGIQVLNGRGAHLVATQQGRWLEDSPARRKALMQAIMNWNRQDLSNPQYGIIDAIKRYYKPGRSISIYVFGDDFRNGSAEEVVNTVEQYVPAPRDGRYPVRIHGVGLTSIQAGDSGMVRFANLMRVLAERTGGAFVGMRGR